MTHKSSGRPYHGGISMVELFRRFPGNAALETWFIERLWSDITIAHVADRTTYRWARSAGR